MNSNHRTHAPKETDSFRNEYNKTSIEKNDTMIYALGGLGEIGKNTYCFEHGNEILIVDAGVRFPEDNLLGVDYVIPDYSHLLKHNRKRKVLVITHGHEDHIGGIPFLLRTVNVEAIYAPRFACALIRKKLEEHRMVKGVKLIEITDESSIHMKHFTVGFFNTIHSIPDSLGILINTPNGRIVETGDFKFDLTPVGLNADYQVMAYMGQIGVDLLMSDSTNSGVEDFSISEKKVAQEILEITRKCSGRLIVATFASNVHRVSQILEAAVRCGRKVCIFGRSMANVVNISRKSGNIRIADEHFLTPEQLNHTPANKICIVCTGSQGEPLAALSRIANGTHRWIKLIPGDTVVFSSSPIPGNGESINHVVNKLFRAGANELIKPKYFMPVHGEYKMLVQHKNTAIETGIPPENIFTCANGDVLVLRDHQVLPTSFRIQADDIYVDGNDISGLSTAVLKDRKILANNGLVSVVIAIDSKENKILMKPVIVSRGFVFIKDSQSLLREAENIVYAALKEKMAQRTTFGELKNCVRSSLEPFLYNKTRRNPIVIPVIINSKSTMAEIEAMRAARNASRAARAKNHGAKEHRRHDKETQSEAKKAQPAKAE